MVMNTDRPSKDFELNFSEEHMMVMAAAPIHAWVDREVVVEQRRALC